MRLLLTVSLLPLLAAAGFAQASSSSASVHCDLTAGKLSRDGKLVRAGGHVKAKAEALDLAADQATCNTETGEVELLGHVQAVLPARADHSVFRYGSATFVTDKSVSIAADRLVVKTGLLQGWGHLVIRGLDPVSQEVELRGDKMYMFLRTADATVSGNIKVSGSYKGPAARRLVFPPDVVK